MKATLLLSERQIVADDAFVELIVGRLPLPVRGSSHAFKYRLAYVVAGKCLVRYDNEAGKGDHRHIKNRESSYPFTSIKALLAAFWRDVERTGP